MVTGWRRAFCTSIPKDREPKVLTEKQQHCDDGSSDLRSPKITSKFGFFSNPSTPRLQSQPVSTPSLRCRTTVTAATTPNSSLPNSPKLLCNVSSTPKKNNHHSNSPRLFNFSNPSSPKSPSSFSLLKSTLRLSKTRCGICLESVKAGQGTAIFTAECSHSFHFPCIASHVKKNQNLVCPVCSSGWKELPLLSFHHTHTLQSGVNKISSPDPSKLKDVKAKSLRVYDDDEPLMSPTSGTRFNPIPETDEDESEQGDENSVSEFQGFFVNPTSTTRLATGGNRSTGNVEMRLLPDAAIVSVGRSYETYAVVFKVRAPSSQAAKTISSSILNPGRRAPIDLVTVVDVSSSMSGAKIQMLKRAMRLVISSLGSADRLSIVAFSATSKRLLPLKRMTTTGRRSARRIVDALGTVGQGMSVSDALKKAAKVLEDRREKNPAATIMMLLSDNPPACDDDQRRYDRTSRSSSPAVSSTRLSSFLDVPVHTIGFGDPSSEDAFANCIGGLLSVVVSDLRLQLGLISGSSSAEIAAVYSLTNRPAVLGYGSVQLGDLYAEEEKELLLELKVPSSSSIGVHHHVLSVRSSYRDPSTMELVYSREQTLLIPRPQAVRSSSSSPNIERLRNLHVATRAVAESRRLAEHNDLTGAHHLLTSARALLIQCGSASAEDYSRGLEAELSELSRLRHQHQAQRQRTTVTSRRDAANNRTEDKPEPLTPTSAWRAAERLAKVAIMRKSMNRVSDLHGFENARF
ncbi:E3 ubiquitin-protein ligase WAVH1 [Humulus lupulus]|uniref:E3 ubiquitin-protein ligase WAVH1 n=1 Tax=Humulus lupulus TaxID=3486 RepID=UPI002B409214|nr:E3 ubiquitin-protein ligase WAVH1 [Humulus lupulus]